MMGLCVVRALAWASMTLILSGVARHAAAEEVDITKDPFLPMFVEKCAACHGEDMRGSMQGPALLGAPLRHGESVDEIERSIREGFPSIGMPAWAQTLQPSQLRSLAILIAEQRVNRHFTQMRMDAPLVVPDGAVRSERAHFTVHTVARGLARYAFAIAPLPDGRILLTEKQVGLSIIAPDGSRTGPIAGTPQVSTQATNIIGLEYGLGWLLDVAPHPDYAHNRWVYLQHTELCMDCEKKDGKFVPASMNRLLRGHIVNDRWVDEQVIWSVPHRFYTSMSDIAAGGRIAFDTSGHVFLSVGIKSGYFEGVQDLASPSGKIHRVFDDGRIPDDNPLAHTAGAMPSIWTIGHRSPQGLAFDPHTGELWQSEMGPRGGDEINLLLPGHNYGWPLRSLGVDYDGTPVEYGKELGIDPATLTLDEPVVDFTPSPAIASFVIYDGDAFPGWKGSFLVGSLKASTLYRVTIDAQHHHVSTEILLKDVARIRDIEVDAQGNVLLLIEHDTGSRILRLSPASDAASGDAGTAARVEPPSHAATPAA